MAGKMINQYSTHEILQKILKYGKVFARMSPLQKANLVEQIQKHGKPSNILIP